MTPEELLADLPLGPGDPRDALLQFRLYMLYLADHVYELRDAGDFREFLLALAEEARKSLRMSPSTEVSLNDVLRTRPQVTVPAPQRRYGPVDATCPRCGHIHEGASECGMQMGKSLFCRCDLDVPA